jgi:hypothetical protein
MPRRASGPGRSGRVTESTSSMVRRSNGVRRRPGQRLDPPHGAVAALADERLDHPRKPAGFGRPDPPCQSGIGRRTGRRREGQPPQPVRRGAARTDSIGSPRSRRSPPRQAIGREPPGEVAVRGRDHGLASVCRAPRGAGGVARRPPVPPDGAWRMRGEALRQGQCVVPERGPGILRGDISGGLLGGRPAGERGSSGSSYARRDDGGRACSPGPPSAHRPRRSEHPARRP